MWTHYAGNYSGAVLEFTCQSELDTPLLLATEVVYLPAPPRLPPLEDWVLSILKEKPLDLTEVFSDQYVKQSHWGYEHDWRALTKKKRWAMSAYSQITHSVSWS